MNRSAPVYDDYRNSAGSSEDYEKTRQASLAGTEMRPCFPPGLAESDKPGLQRPLVPDEYLLAGPLLRVDELAQRDRTVHDIGLGQARPFLQALEVIPGLRDQGNRDPLERRRRPGSIVMILFVVV